MAEEVLLNSKPKIIFQTKSKNVVPKKKKTKFILEILFLTHILAFIAVVVLIFQNAKEMEKFLEIGSVKANGTLQEVGYQNLVVPKTVRNWSKLENSSWKLKNPRRRRSICTCSLSSTSFCAGNRSSRFSFISAITETILADSPNEVRLKCVGTNINEYLVLTSAECFWKSRRNLSNYRVKVGSTDWSSEALGSIRIKKILHPTNDLRNLTRLPVLLVLNEEIIPSKTITFAEILHKNISYFENVTVSTYFWKSSAGPIKEEKLIQTKFFLTKCSHCVGPNLFCAEIPSTTCPNRHPISGFPLFFHKKLIGIQISSFCRLHEEQTFREICFIGISSFFKWIQTSKYYFGSEEIDLESLSLLDNNTTYLDNVSFLKKEDPGTFFKKVVTSKVELGEEVEQMEVPFPEEELRENEKEDEKVDAIDLDFFHIFRTNLQRGGLEVPTSRKMDGNNLKEVTLRTLERSKNRDFYLETLSRNLVKKSELPFPKETTFKTSGKKLISEIKSFSSTTTEFFSKNRSFYLDTRNLSRNLGNKSDLPVPKRTIYKTSGKKLVSEMVTKSTEIFSKNRDFYLKTLSKNVGKKSKPFPKGTTSGISGNLETLTSEDVLFEKVMHAFYNLNRSTQDLPAIQKKGPVWRNPLNTPKRVSRPRKIGSKSVPKIYESTINTEITSTGNFGKLGNLFVVKKPSAHNLNSFPEVLEPFGSRMEISTKNYYTKQKFHYEKIFRNWNHQKNWKPKLEPMETPKESTISAQKILQSFHKTSEHTFPIRSGTPISFRFHTEIAKMPSTILAGKKSKIASRSQPNIPPFKKEPFSKKVLGNRQQKFLDEVLQQEPIEFLFQEEEMLLENSNIDNIYLKYEEKRKNTKRRKFLFHTLLETLVSSINRIYTDRRKNK